MTNHGSLRSSFARIFLRSLSKINCSVGPSFPRDVNRRQLKLKRYRSIRISAYTSMASAVGTRRVWSRAVLRKIRCGGVKISRWSSEFPARRKSEREQGNMKKGDIRGTRKKLRRLVPGGQAIKFHRLLDETAHYIKCLRTQVEVMRSIADYYKPI